MKKWFALAILTLSLGLLNSCQKETSFEGDGTLAQGSLQLDGSGECLPKNVSGAYEVGTQLGEGNYIDVTLNVTLAGQYTINTDTTNGFYFRAVGIFTSTGQKTVRLKGIGTPIEAGTHSLIVTFDSSSCVVEVVTLPEGAGGPAVYTFDGAPGACSSPTFTGDFTEGIPLDASNTATFNVNVTTIGTYDITTTTVSGITFTGAATFGNTGPQTITLTASGVPTASGAVDIPTPSPSSCTFTVNVLGQAEFTIDCAAVPVIDGDYRTGQQLNPDNTIVMQVDVTVAGGYSVTSTDVNGMTFIANGSFPTTGPATVEFIGTGTPATAGSFDIVLPGTTGNCNVPITVTEGAVISGEWRFTTGATTYSGNFEDATIDTQDISGFKVLDLIYDGLGSANEQFFFELLDVDGAINVNETYSTQFSTTANLAQMGWADATVTNTFLNDPSDTGVTIIFTVSSINTTTRRIEGTFAGTTRKEDNSVVNVTNGFFSGNYQ